MDRSTKQNPSFNPFSMETGWVIKSDLVEVVRAYVPEPPVTCTFQKTYKRSGTVNLEPFANYERSMLVRLDEDGVDSVAKYHTLHGAATGAAVRVTSYDVGPSLASWLDLDFAGPNDEPSFAHPLSSPKALVQILRDSLLALEKLHEKGYVHCDVHAGNVCMAVGQQNRKNVVQAVSGKVTLIDFGYTFKRGDALKPPAALPIQPTSTLHSPSFMAALEADFRRGDNQATEVLRLDGRIDLHAMGLMGRVLHGALQPLWGTADNDQRQRAEDLVQRLLRDLLAQDACPGEPMPQGLHQQLALPLARWLDEAGEWLPFPFRARGLKSIAQPLARDVIEPVERPPMRPPAAQPSPSTQQAGPQPAIVLPPRATPPRLAPPAPPVIGRGPVPEPAVAPPPAQLPALEPASTPPAPAPVAVRSAVSGAEPSPVSAAQASAWRSLAARQRTGLAIVLALAALAIAAALLRDRWWFSGAAPGTRRDPAIQVQEPLKVPPSPARVTDGEFCKFKPEDHRCSKK